MHLFLISVKKQNNCDRNVSFVIDMFQKKCCDQLACEPPSEETERSILAIVSKIHLQAVLFLSINFGVKEGL